MTRLGEILIARGAVSTDGLRSALEACRRNGGRLGTWLVRLGLVNEATLLEALSEQTGCPSASALELATASADVRAAIPAALAKCHMVVAFNRQGRNVDIAMSNPNDLLLVDEISSITRMVVRPHVATEAALAAALAIPVSAAEGAAPAPYRTPLREWRQFWRLDSAAPDLFKATDAPALAPPVIAGAAFPSLAPLGTAGEAILVSGLEELAEGLALAGHRDQVAALALGYLLTVAPRAALFSLHQAKVMGWAARGEGIVDEDFETLILPLDRPSIFLNLTNGMDMHAGPLVGGEGNQLLLEAIGQPTPKEAVVVPLRLRGKTIGFVWADRGDEGIGTIPLSDVQEAARLVGLALEAIVIKQKIRSGRRLTEGPRAD